MAILTFKGQIQGLSILNLMYDLIPVHLVSN